jgi:flagellar basal-body rod protein FlgG
VMQPGSAAGSQTIVPSGLQLGLGVRPAGNTVIQTQGSFTETDNPLDLVISGKGFFQIQLPSGQTAYTRDGNFQLNATGTVVDDNGNPLQPQITIPAQAQGISIAADGTVSYSQPGTNASQTAGQIQLANFANPGGLNSVGNNLFMPTDASGDPVVGSPGGADGVGTLQQGYLESSNVSVVEEFINMLSTQRAYEANSKVVKAADQMYQQVNNITQ